MIHLLNPLALGLAALSGLIVLMYLLKLRRKREVFSSTMLWVKSVEDLTANAPFQRLRQNLLMYLQILALLLFVAALARPTLWLKRARGQARVILLDNSASMNATDGPGGRSRLEAALDKARELIRNMAAGDEAMVITLGGVAQVVQPFTEEPGTLMNALGRVAPTDAASCLRDALTMARGVIKGRRNAVMTLIGDGGGGYLAGLLTQDDPMEFVSVGLGEDNWGIVTFDLRESFEQKGEAQIFAEVANFSPRPVAALLRLVVDGQTIQAREETVEPKGRKGFVFSDLKSVARARIRLELSPPDQLAADNAVEGFVDLESRNTVLLVSNGNFFLERLLGLLPDAKVRKIAPKDFQPGMGGDLIIYDQFAPPKIGPGSHLFINAVPPVDGFSADPERLKNQTVLDWNRLHPVTRFLSLDGLAITETLRIHPPDWMLPLVESAQAPLALVGERQTVRLGVISFDLYASDWPLQVSFPVFLTNLVRWLAGASRGDLSGIHHTGDTIAIPATGPVTITGPDGQAWTRQPDNSHTAYFNETYRVGVYSATGAAVSPQSPDGGSPALAGESQTPVGERLFAVNLLSEAESDITPRQEIVSGEKKVTASIVTRENREVWDWLALVALAVLMIEWHLYCRRAWL